ncbi:MAG: aminopeptidase P family protein [Kordiimonadaceae bacterium]|nr:aminopeptidase P family protein [Kordiimonadaceae bacterium]MBO6567390.1 aminopeptidase P family protein [Kordiimonadaceae bacterium]MBO6963396.1 aminopeptidase P family protein [Kordiimonadaceae bacterium]
MKHLLFTLVATLAFAFSAAAAETWQYPEVLSMKERAALEDAWLKKRLDTVVPAVMRERGVDMWVLIAREYNEDPVVKTMLPATWLSARRRTVLMFFDNGESVERLAVSRYAVGDIFPAAWNPEEQPDQWARVAELITERNPNKIALNVSDTFALADGMSESQHRGLIAALPDALKSKVVYDPAIAIGWLERRIPEEMDMYPHVVGLAHAIIAEGFSDAVITPGITTTADVMWWYRDKIRQMGVVAWFHPTVSIQRRTLDDRGQKMTELFDPMKDSVIRRGDLIHVDFGITYMGLNTDTQHHGYILQGGETDAPAGIKAGLATGNKLQDILTNNYRTGASGDEVLAASRAQAIREGIEPSIYTHPIGYHGHGAGATIGLWDSQGGVPGRGDYPVVANTAWSIELNATVAIPEWGGQKVRIMLEEDAFFDGTNVRYIDGRQTELHIIGRN